MKILIIGGGTMGQAITKCLQTSVSKIETFIVEQDDDTRLKVKELTNNIFRNVDEALSSENKKKKKYKRDRKSSRESRSSKSSKSADRK